MSGPTGFDTPPRRTGHGQDPTRTPGHGRLATAALGPLAATVVVGLPLLLTARLDAFWQAPAFLGPAWLVILVLAAPTTALIMNKRRPLALRRALAAAASSRTSAVTVRSAQPLRGPTTPRT